VQLYSGLGLFASAGFQQPVHMAQFMPALLDESRELIVKIADNG